MPGVPSYRGCEACRRQKKKCDKGKPSCSRCARLDIPCIGVGQQRFKFKDQSDSFMLVGSHVGKRPDGTLLSLFGAPHRTPSSKATIATGSFVSLLDVTDPRFDVFCYGGFMKDLPKRLGHDRALDASAAAFASAIRVVRTKQKSPEAIRKYVAALNAVQQNLTDPGLAYSAETVCAIYLIMVVHPWLASRGDRYPSHGEGMAQLLKYLVNKKSHDEFFRGLITTVTVAVILEAVFNPSIKIEWAPKAKTLGINYEKEEAEAAKQGLNFRSLNVDRLHIVPELIQNPRQNLHRIQDYYDLILMDYPGVKNFTDTVIEPACVGPATTLPLKLVRAQTQLHAGQCLMLTMAIIFNAFLRRYSEIGQREILEAELYNFCNDAIILGERAAGRRPLAAGHIPMSLVAAWLTSPDRIQALKLKLMLEDYQNDYIMIDLIRKASDLKKENLKGVSIDFGTMNSSVAEEDPITNLKSKELGDDQRVNIDQYYAEFCCIL